MKIDTLIIALPLCLTVMIAPAQTLTAAIQSCTASVNRKIKVKRIK